MTAFMTEVTMESIDRWRGRCPVCDHQTLRVTTYSAYPWVLINCYSCSRDGLKSTSYLRALANRLGTTVPSLLRGPELYPALELRAIETQGEVGRPGDTPLAGLQRMGDTLPLPNRAQVERLSNRLWFDAGLEARKHLRHRCVSKKVAKEVGLGYGQISVPSLWDRSPSAFVFPCWNKRPGKSGRILSGVKLRYWPNTKDGHDRLNWPGHDAVIYPWRPSQTSGGSGPILIVEGEWDCLAARSQGVEAYTSTAGQHWPEAWDAFLPVGRDVIICYDAGESEARGARELAERLEGSVWEWPAGTRDGYDLGDFIRDGGSIWEKC